MKTEKNFKELKNEISNYIRDNPNQVSDYRLKKYWHDLENKYDIDVELYEVIDELVFDKKIERFYPADSMVPIYRVVEAVLES